MGGGKWGTWARDCGGRWLGARGRTPHCAISSCCYSVLCTPYICTYSGAEYTSILRTPRALHTAGSQPLPRTAHSNRHQPRRGLAVAGRTRFSRPETGRSLANAGRFSSEIIRYPQRHTGPGAGAGALTCPPAPRKRASGRTRLGRQRSKPSSSFVSIRGARLSFHAVRSRAAVDSQRPPPPIQFHRRCSLLGPWQLIGMCSPPFQRHSHVSRTRNSGRPGTRLPATRNQ